MEIIKTWPKSSAYAPMTYCNISKHREMPKNNNTIKGFVDSSNNQLAAGDLLVSIILRGYFSHS